MWIFFIIIIIICFFGENNISCELSALIKFYLFFLKNKKLNTLTLLELYFIFPLLGNGLFRVRC